MIIPLVVAMISLALLTLADHRHFEESFIFENTIAAITIFMVLAIAENIAR